MLRSQRSVVVLLLATATALASATLPAYARDNGGSVAVTGEVNSPITYSAAQLAMLQQTSVTFTLGTRQVTDTGVLLETLVTGAGPAYPASLLNTKNELLRVTATVRGAAHNQVTFAVGELDSNFGNHPALLALTQNGKPIDGGPQLVVPGDRAPLRLVSGVSEVERRHRHGAGDHDVALGWQSGGVLQWHAPGDAQLGVPRTGSPGKASP